MICFEASCECTGGGRDKELKMGVICNSGNPKENLSPKKGKWNSILKLATILKRTEDGAICNSRKPFLKLGKYISSLKCVMILALEVQK